MHLCLKGLFLHCNIFILFMNKIAIVFLLINATALLVLPRRLAPLPLLIGACYVTRGQGIDLGPFSFSVLRLLILFGFIRVIFKGERLSGLMSTLDWIMLMWSASAVVSSIFHKDPSAALIFRLGLIYDAAGVYFLIRIFCQSFDDLIILFRIIAILLLPVGLEMAYEKVAASNMFSFFGGIPEIPQMRHGRIRAQGPFAHPILAGTVGATCLPLMVGLWMRHRKEALIGITACLAMVYTSSSSGPILSVMAGLGALFLWRYREHIRLFRWLFILGYIGLDIFMNAPAYFIFTRINVVSGSTGWHRARLIKSAIDHIHEWWLGGTDYTRHWMPTGVSWSPDHTDITNYYLKMGVIGGLPLMFIFIALLWRAFRFVGQTVQHGDSLSSEDRFIIWTLGASLFSIAATSLSVSFFDQSFLFLYLVLAAIGSMRNIWKTD